MKRILKLGRKIFPLLALLGAWALFFWRFAWPPNERLAYTPGDFSLQYVTFRDVAYRALVTGRFPLWTDCLWAGYPFSSDPQAQLFYPPAWLGFGWLRLQGWGNFPLEALTAEVAAHYLALSFFLYWFLRSLKLRPAASTLGAVVFTYGGYLTSYPPLQTTVLETVTWLPLVLLGLGRWAETRRWRFGLLTAGALALAFLAGHPQTFVLAGLLAGAYFAFRAGQAHWRWQNFLVGGAGLGGLVLALTAVQLLPSIQFVLHSTRPSMSFNEVSGGFPFGDVLQFGLTGWVSYWHPLYVGILPLLLAVFALGRRAAEGRFWAGAACVGLLLAFGTKGVVYDVAYWLVPGYRWFRSPERAALVVSFALAVLAAYGAQLLLGALSRRGRRALVKLERASNWFLAGTVGVLAGATCLARLNIDPSDWGRLPERAGVLALALGLAWLVLKVRAYVPALRHWLPALCVSVVVVELFAANRPVNVVPAYDPFPYNPLLESIYTEPGFFRVSDEDQLPGQWGCATGYQTVEGITPYYVGTYRRFLETAPDTVAWPVLGVRYVVSWRAELYDSVGTVITNTVVARGDTPDHNGNVTTVHRLEAFEPQRAFLVHQAHWVPNDTAGLARLAEADFDPWHEAVVAQPVEVAPGDGQDQVVVEQMEAGRLRFKTSTTAAAVLVVSEAYFPGWQAKVDGRPVAVVRADTAVLAAAVPAGTHTVELVYAPPLLAGSGLLSGLAWLLALGGVGYAGWRRPLKIEMPKKN